MPTKQTLIATWFENGGRGVYPVAQRQRLHRAIQETSRKNVIISAPAQLYPLNLDTVLRRQHTDESSGGNSGGRGTSVQALE